MTNQAVSVVNVLLIEKVGGGYRSDQGAQRPPPFWLPGLCRGSQSLYIIYIVKHPFEEFGIVCPVSNGWMAFIAKEASNCLGSCTVVDN